MTPLARIISSNPLLDADDERALAADVQEASRLEAVRASMLSPSASSPPSPSPDGEEGEWGEGAAADSAAGALLLFQQAAAKKGGKKASSSSSSSDGEGGDEGGSSGGGSGGSGGGSRFDPELWASAAGLGSVAELQRRLERGARARDRMLCSNTKLVISIARRHLGKGLELDDLIQEGYTGLLRCVEKFDPSRGFKFSTYAHWWIRQSVVRAVHEHGRVVRLPVHLHEMMARVTKAEGDLAQALGRQPTPEETAAAAGLTTEKIAALRRAYSTTRSIDDPGAGGGGGGSAGSAMPGGSSAGAASGDAQGGAGGAGEAGDAADLSPSRASAFDLAISASLASDVESVLSETLGARESGVLRMRYGLDDGRPKTLEEIGAAFSVTRERIRQIEAKALLKLRGQQPGGRDSLEDYVDDDGDGLMGLQWKSATTKARS